MGNFPILMIEALVEVVSLDRSSINTPLLLLLQDNLTFYLAHIPGQASLHKAPSCLDALRIGGLSSGMWKADIFLAALQDRHRVKQDQLSSGFWTVPEEAYLSTHWPRVQKPGGEEQQKAPILA